MIDNHNHLFFFLGVKMIMIIKKQKVKMVRTLILTKVQPLSKSIIHRDTGTLKKEEEEERLKKLKICLQRMMKLMRKKNMNTYIIKEHYALELLRNDKFLQRNANGFQMSRKIFMLLKYSMKLCIIPQMVIPQILQCCIKTWTLTQIRLERFIP